MNEMTSPQPPALYTALRRVIDTLDGALMFLGCAMLFLLMGVIVLDVGLRYLFNSPLGWSYEVISSYLMPGLFFLAVSHTLKAHGHVSVDILHNYVSDRARYVFETLTCMAALPAFAVCAYISAGNTWKDFSAAAASSSGMGLPTWSISILLPIGFGMLSLRLALHLTGYLGSLISTSTWKKLPPIAGTEELAE